MNINSWRVTLSYTTVVFFLILCFITPSFAYDDIYLFSKNGEYIVINKDTGKLIKKGNLWKSGISRVYDGVIDHHKSRIYLKSDYAVFILDMTKLELLKKITTPSPEDLMNFYVSPDGGKIVISTLNNQTNIVSKLLDGETFQEKGDIPCNSFSANSHFMDSVKFVCIEPVSKDRVVTIIDVVKNNILNKLSIKSIIQKLEHDDKLVDMDGREGKILFLTSHKANGVESDRKLLVIDLTANKLSAPLPLKIDQVDIYGEYKLIPGSNKIAIDEYTIVPLKKGLIKTQKEGRVHIFDTDNAQRLHSINLPRDGKIVGMDSVGKELYHLSGGSLTKFNTENTTHQSFLPFSTKEIDKKSGYSLYIVLF